MNEQIQMIEKALAATRARYVDSSPYFILWGCLGLCGVIVQYFVLNTGKAILFSWLFISLFGVVTQLVLSRRGGKDSRGSTTLQEASIGLCWGLLGVSMLFIAFVAPATRLIDYSAIQPLLMMQIWIGSLFTGLTLRFTPLVVLANIWLVAIVASLLFPAHAVLCFGFALLVGYLIPALIMRRQAPNANE